MVMLLHQHDICSLRYSLLRAHRWRCVIGKSADLERHARAVPGGCGGDEQYSVEQDVVFTGRPYQVYVTRG
jgi:hypothetical protein